jgi:hypothetical protein
MINTTEDLEVLKYLWLVLQYLTLGTKISDELDRLSFFLPNANLDMEVLVN